MKFVLASSLAGLFILLSADSSFAQQTQETPRVGVMVGFNRSYFAVSEGGDSSMKTGLMGGVFAVLLKDRRIKLQPEFQISQRDVGVTSAGVESTFSTTYANVSFFMRNNLWKLYTITGPQIMIPLKSSISTASREIDVKENINADFSIIAGVGKQFGRFGLEGRWDSGFKELENFPTGLFVKRNRAITVMFITGF